MIRYGLFLVFVLLGLSNLWAQNPCVKSTEGKEFWFGFMENRPGLSCDSPTENYLEVSVISRFNCSFTITLGNSSEPIVSEVLLPNIPKKFRIDRSLAEPSGSEKIEKKSLHLVSDQVLNLYAMNYGMNSTDATVIFPIEALGNEYYALCYEPHIVYQTINCGTFQTGKNSEFVVVASEDQTYITIVPSKITDQHNPANKPIYIVLNKGELYQVQSMNSENLPGQGDLTGTYIKSDKPVALYCGSWATTVPSTVSYALDHLYEQIPPVQSWGRKFVAVPLKLRGKDTYRILASMDQTSIKVGNNVPVVRNRGEFFEFMLNEDETSIIECNHPVLLAQYSNSNEVDRPPNKTIYDWDGDPFMLIISPVDHIREEATFVTFDMPEIPNMPYVSQKFYVNIVTKDNSVGQILLDEQPIAFKSLPNSGYSYAQIPINQGNHNLSSTESGYGFIAYVYSFEWVGSYGYGVGYNLDTKLDLGGDLHFARDTILLCKGESKILDAGSQFSTYQWNTGETSQKISVNKEGYYFVTATNSGSCSLTDTVYVFESNPVIDLGRDTTFCTKPPVVLDAGAGFSSWLWSTGETTQKITVHNGGKYSVLAVNKYGCQAADTILVGFAPPPKLQLEKKDQLICGNKSTTLKISSDPGTYSLTSTDPKVTVNGLKVEVSEYGTYPFKLSASAGSGCIADTSFTLSFNPIPTVGFNVNETTCYSQVPEVIYLGNAALATTFFTWIFASDTIAKGVGSNKVQLSIPENQTNTSLYLKVEDKGCVSSNSLAQIKLAPAVSFIAADTVVCVLETVQLTATSAATPLDYLWDWGDGTSNHQTANGTHSYVKSGQYDIQLTVSFGNNCSRTVQKAKYIAAAAIPTVTFSLQENQCLNPGVQSLFYTGSGDEPDKYDWDLSGFQSGELISNPGNTKGPLVFDMKTNPRNRVSLQVISKHGCTSERKILPLQRKPDFTVSAAKNSGCAPFDAEFNALTRDAVDQVDYKWSFGDGTAGSGSTVAHNYALPKQAYDVTVVANSQTTGCRDTLVKQQWISIYPMPNASFSVQNPEQCITTPFRFTATDQGAGNQYLWRWGDLSSSTEKEASHTYSLAGDYDIFLKVTNSFGCADSTFETGLVYAAPVPSIGFSLDPSLCLPHGIGTVSYVGNAKEQDKYLWDLSELAVTDVIQSPGDGAGPLVFNLVNKPAATISLQVVTSFGCTTENKRLYVTRKPQFSIEADRQEGCAPFPVTFKAEAGDQVDRLEYAWNLGSEGTFTGESFFHTFADPAQTYDLSVKAVSKITGCTADTVQKEFIHVHPDPLADFSADPPSTSNDQPDVSFVDKSRDAVRYVWNFGDGSFSDLKDPTHKFGKVGIHKVSLTVYNLFDCSNSATLDYEVGLSKIYTPNAFSPGAVNPADREFKLYSNGVVAEGYHLKILSRWNDVVFECHNEIKAWDGKLINGAMAQAGNYIWILEFADFLGRKHRQMGSVMLVY
jgi:PKD repeat protein